MKSYIYQGIFRNSLTGSYYLVSKSIRTENDLRLVHITRCVIMDLLTLTAVPVEDCGCISEKNLESKYTKIDDTGIDYT